MKIGIVAGEKSGDLLGAELIESIKKRYPKAEFFGLCGPLMQAEGAVSIDDMDKISIMGLDGLFSSLGDILSIRKRLYKHFINHPPDVFIGIDVPDFNLSLERRLRAKGIPTVHYVSPTVWAWRSGRVKKVKAAVDLILTLFPFEQRFYEQYQVPVKYVGHPMARKVLEWPDRTSFRRKLGSSELRLIAVLPGSRMSEVSRLAEPMLNACKALSKDYPDLLFVVPAANPRIAVHLQQMIESLQAPISVIEGQSRDLLSVADVAILASGTAALEAALFACPMVVMYKVAPLSALIFGHTIEVEHFSMPNHLTNPPVVPELMQSQATAENCYAEVVKLLDDSSYYQKTRTALATIAPRLAENSSELACEAIMDLLHSRDIAS